MARYSHQCARCDTGSEPTTDYQEALEAQAFHRDQMHGGHAPRQGDTIKTHPTGWSDGDTLDRCIMVGAVIVMIILAFRFL
ncbi:hypothetical protein ACFWVB_02495 [Streptomyces microflavus]|uniref:hypothetical protein n=1 Tax=Streptomyces microflavus TaxID=1919 RepID=UPI00365032E4